MQPENPNIQSASDLLEAGDAAGAALLMEQAVAADPDDGLASLYLGVARSQSGDVTGGVSALRRASELLPDRAGVWYNLGVALTRLGETREAQAALATAISLDPSNAKARLALDAIAPQQSLPNMPASATADNQLVTPPPPTPVAPRLRESASPLVRGRSGEDAANSTVAGQSGGGSAVGARYVPAAPRAAQQSEGEAPSGRKILRGLGWGFVCGQWWTLLNTFWHLVYGGAGSGFEANVLLVAIFVVVFGIAGTVAGLIIAATNARGNTGAIIGAVTGLLLFAAEFFLLDGANPSQLFNALFWFFTGRYVGANIVRHVHGRTNQ